MTDVPAVPDAPRDDEPQGGAPGPAMPDLGGLLDSFQKVQDARAQVYEGVAGGGAVRVRASGDMTFESVEIRPDVVDPGDVAMLNDLVLAALHSLSTAMLSAQQQAMGALGGLDVGALLGGAVDEADGH